MAYVFSPAPAAAVPVVGSPALFPVRRVYCVGQNYALHAQEMGGDGRQPPFFFSKPGDLIFTGTPAGVSTVQRGDVLTGGIDGVGELAVRLV